MKYDYLTFFAFIGGVIFVLSVISAGLIKRFADKLTLKQSFFIALLAYFIMMIVVVVYYLFRGPIGLPREMDTVATLVSLAVAGTVITHQARLYGVEKTGWFGVGAKTMFSLIVLSWILVGIGFVFSLLK